MEVRQYLPSDYKTVSQWWDKHNKMDFMPENFLPETGLIVDGVAVMFYYSGNDNIGLIQWPVSNSSNSPITIYKAFDKIIKTYKQAAGPQKLIVSYPNSTGLQRLLERNGFTMVNEFNKEMIWGVR